MTLLHVIGAYLYKGEFMNKLNFKISELIQSDTAIQNNINNMPDINSLDNLLNLIVFCLQPIRDKLKKPMIITSGYRNLQVNKLVGGVSNSQHTKGQAVEVLERSISIKEYRRLTSLIFRHILKKQGTNTIKANIMSWAVQVFQATINFRQWRI